MKLDYFYGQECEQFIFYRIPKILFTEPTLKEMSTDAKVLYGLMLDRMELSMRNGWFDKSNRAYIIFPISHVMEFLNCADKKATKLLRELEAFTLIERKKQGQGHADLIFVKKIVTDPHGSAVNRQKYDSKDVLPLNDDSRPVKSTIQEPTKPRCTKNNKSNTECSDTYPIQSEDREDDGLDEMNIDHREYLHDYLSRKLCIEEIKKNQRFHEDIVDDLLDLIVDTCASNRNTIRIGGEDRPALTVKSTFMKLKQEHIEYVMDCFLKNTHEVKNIRQYLLTALYNAPFTMKSYYAALVNAHMAGGVHTG